MARVTAAWLLALTLPMASGAPSAPPAVAQVRSQQPVPGGPVIPLPDLTIFWVGWVQGTPACQGNKRNVDITVRITNKGPGPAVLPAEWTKPWVTAYLAKPVAGFVQPYTTLGKATTLQPGQSVTLQIGTLVPGGGVHEFIVKVDPGNAIRETNEGNNSYKGSVPGC
jgi:hypothetical protein